MKPLWIFLIVGICLLSCSSAENAGATDDNRHSIVIKKEVIQPNYLGNGVQWGGYESLANWTGNKNLTVSDKEKLFERVSFMCPQLLRIMISAGSTYLDNNEFTPGENNNLLSILDYCQSNNIPVVFGEWGHTGGSSIDENWLDKAVDFLTYLVVDKKYTCIKYYNMVNEPNGDWSSINGDYDLWQNLIIQLHEKMDANEALKEIEIIGPDIAIWDTNLTWWIDKTLNGIGTIIGMYDIHTYPTESLVRGGNYQDLIMAYKRVADTSKPMLMGELGFKYSASSNLGQENLRRIAQDKYASDDSNMFVYDSFYGIDIADALMQNMLAGYSGVILWNMDDAMYNNPVNGNEKLKRWGFWNILGSEKFESDDDENIRPWFYTASLMCRYFPKGSCIFEVQLPDKFGVRAIAAEKDGKYTIAIVNSHMVNYDIKLKMENKLILEGMKVYSFVAQEGKNFEGKTNEKGFAMPEQQNVTYNFSTNKAYDLTLTKQSFILFTNMP